MADISKCLRSGQIAGISRPSLATDKEIVPLTIIEIESQIDIGTETLSEKCRVLMLGQDLRDYWDSLHPEPRVGDTLRLNSCLCYVRNGVLCCRPSAPDQIEVIYRTKESQGKEKDTDILRPEDFVSAAEYFKAISPNQ